MYISPSMQKGLQQSTNNMETRYFHILPFSHTFRRILLRIQGLQSISSVT